MTYIEFFDENCIENICACLSAPPDRVILVGDKKEVIEKHAARYTEIMRRRGFEVEFVCICVSRNAPAEIVRVLSGIVKENYECAFDLTGGDETYLTALGVIFERFPERRLQLHRFNIRDGAILDCDLDGKTVFRNGQAKLSVDENVRVYGGSIKSCGAHGIDETAGMFEDAGAIWDICRVNTRQWNVLSNVLACAEECCEQNYSSLSTAFEVKKVTERLNRAGNKAVLNRGIIAKLNKAGLINAFEDSGVFTITYKNEFVRRCIIVAGLALEICIYASAVRAREKDGTHVYNDAAQGVSIDWFGAEGSCTANEIDVMLMHGMAPVFVSCKNGKVGVDELYKLGTVGDRFGGKYARKVLVSTSPCDMADNIRERAKEMHIRVVEGSVDDRGNIVKPIIEMNGAELEKLVKTFWIN